MMKQMKTRVYTVDEAREEQKIIEAREQNRMRNQIWEGIVAKQAAQEKPKKPKKLSGVYLKSKAIKLRNELPPVSKKEQAVIKQNMNEIAKDKIRQKLAA